MSDTNNLFKFATKELSQDAVICWILNWLNFPDSDLYGLGKQFFSVINDSELDKGEKIVVHQQKESADIVVVVPSQQKIIIIEDKVYSSEHDNQIETYKNRFNEIGKQKEVLGIQTETPYCVKTVYLKTGFFYDNDKLVKADYIVDGKLFYNIVSNPEYQGKSEILDCFVQHLKGLLEWYDNHGNITGRYDDGGYHLSWEHYAQYRLMRFVFPEKMWDGVSQPYKVYSDSSSGRPWTEMDVAPAFNYIDSDDKFTLFWRIDSATKGPYLSFRLYEWFDKTDEKKRNRHIDCYNKLKEICEETVNSENDIGIFWKDVNDGYRGNYYESALFTIYLAPYLEKWDEVSDKLADYVRRITSEIMDKISDIAFG